MEAYISKINYVSMLIMNANTICTFRIIYKKEKNQVDKFKKLL